LKEKIDEGFEGSVEELHYYAESKVQREESKPLGGKERNANKTKWTPG
jgi:hypothetical protein